MNEYLAATWSDRHLEPEEDNYIESWNGAEIYQGEEYLEFFNGDIVHNKKEDLLEYISDNWEDVYEMILENADKRTVE